MINRELGLEEIYERIKSRRAVIGVKTFKRLPTAPIQDSDMPCIFMLEEIDNVIKQTSRGNTGYPVRRVLEVILELVTTKDVDIKAMYRRMRQAVFSIIDSDPVVYNARIADNVFINENRTEGPVGYGLPDILAMRLVLDLVYTDDVL